MATKGLLRYTGEMSELHKHTPEEALRARARAVDFVAQYKGMIRLLFEGKLFDVVEGSKARGKKEWRNVAEHCIAVGRGLQALGELLGLEPEIIDEISTTGVLHDWNKRVTKDPSAFTPEELTTIERQVGDVLERSDPDGHYIDATEPRGLTRLESDDASVAEHCVHFVDLSCMPQGFVPIEKRFEDLRKRHSNIDYDTEHPGFWDRKEALARREEAMFLNIIRSRGVTVPEGTRVCDLITEHLHR